MAVNPVFVNELRQSVFRRRGGLVVGLLAAGAILFAMVAQIGSLRTIIVYGPVLLVPLLVPAIASGAFAKEYEQQTWLDLYLTRLTNAQVVWGKFGAFFAQVAIALLAFAPALVLMLLGDYSRRLSDLRFDVVPIKWQLAAIVTTASFIGKLLLSACLYILLTMICSRYSSTRRMALTWSYIALALYTGLGVLIWSQVGALDYQIYSGSPDALSASSGSGVIELEVPGFMESFHLIFCCVVGLGAAFLLWISLSEQRGYRGSGDGAAATRAWQPIAHRAREPLR